jgi:hypothetical protein
VFDASSAHQFPTSQAVQVSTSITNELSAELIDTRDNFDIRESQPVSSGSVSTVINHLRGTQIVGISDSAVLLPEEDTSSGVGLSLPSGGHQVCGVLFPALAVAVPHCPLCSIVHLHWL